MKNLFIMIITMAITLISCGEPPLYFSEDALSERALTLEGQSISLKEVLEAHKGKIILIDVWASWCGDCIKGLPRLREIQSEFSDVEYIFLSVDRNQERWQQSIEKYAIKGHHYFLPKGQKGAFGDFLNSNWIPRYMVIDKNGGIKLYKAKKASDERIVEALN